MKKFPVLQSGEKIYINWNCLNEDWALKIHGQTLERLSARGGLSPQEIVLNMERKEISDIQKISSVYADNLVRKIQLSK